MISYEGEVEYVMAVYRRENLGLINDIKFCIEGWLGFG